MYVLIVGAGIMGLSTAWALVRKGHRVTIFEQGDVPNEHGSSVDQHRLIRHAYGAEEGYTRMVDNALAAWDLLWADLGQVLYEPTGTLVMAGATTREGVEGDWARQSRATLDMLGIPITRMSPTEATLRWPHLRAEGCVEALHMPSGGVLLAREIVAGLARWLDAHPMAQVHRHRRVEDLDGTRLRTRQGWVEADRVLIAAGPWVTKLAPSLTGKVTPSRQVVIYAEPPHRWREAWARSPMVLDFGGGGGIYVVPPVRGTTLKIGDHSFSLTGDPDQDRATSEAEAQATWALCARRFTDFEAHRLASARTCFYTVDPEERFALLPTSGGLAMTGFSGHGFKFGSLMGLAAAHALCTPEDQESVRHWAAGHAPPADMKHPPFDLR
jgi:glycine/D-amino acid oxidase-like deaminating enzyme